MSAWDILIPLLGLGFTSGLLTWFNGPGLEQWQHRYRNALDDGRLDPSVKEWEYEELEMKYGPFEDYTNLHRVE